MTTPTPAALTDLRRKTGASFAWRPADRDRRNLGVAITPAEYDALPAASRAKWLWLPDPRLVEALRQAERAHTSTFNPDKGTFA